MALYHHNGENVLIVGTVHYWLVQCPDVFLGEFFQVFLRMLREIIIMIVKGD